MAFIEKYPQLKIIQKLARENKVSIYLVGGFVRDFYLGNEKRDFDFAVSNNALKLARQFAKEIKGAYILLDDERNCARVAKKTKGGLFTFDFADFRAGTFAGDLAHRDFTINTLAIDLTKLDGKTDFNKALEDRLNGLRDIDSKKIRMTNRSVFKEDPLRILRAFSLRATLLFSIEPATLRQIKQDKDLLRQVSPERVRDEFFKVLAANTASQVLVEMDKIGLIEKIIPQVKVMFACKQGGYHHLDVWRHTLETLVELDKLKSYVAASEDLSGYCREIIASERPRWSLIKLAALLHDIGKPETLKKENGKISFHGHENLGKKIAGFIAPQLKLSTGERHALEDMVLWHLRPGYLSDLKKPTEKAVYRFFRDAKTEAVSILLLSVADQRATRGPMSLKKDLKHHEEVCLGLIKKYFDDKKKTPFVRLLDGHSVMRALKLKPSPLIGRILSALDEKQSLGKIKNKSDAIKEAEKIYRRVKQ